MDNRIRELQTAGYYDLVDWAKQLGLETSGGVPEIRQRIASSLGLTLPPVVEAGGKTLSIDSALKAGLLSVDAPGNGKLLRISGGLQITLVDNEKRVTHIIRADELWYDQANEEMTARGNVVYTMIRDKSKEPDLFRGDSLTFRLSDSEGVFYGGSSERDRKVGNDTLPFKYKGDAIRRSTDDVIVMDNGSITSSVAADPNYRILATRIWILAPGEWGLQNAVLYLGRVPVFYFPFFFQPGDEFFFNPVLSFPDAGDRRGTSLQTTTYLLGHKKASAAALSFLQMDDTGDGEQKVQKGLFMVRGTPPQTTVPDTWTLKVLADFYSNLGFLTGVDATLPGLWGLQTFRGMGGIGITRSVDTNGNLYTVPLTSIQAAQDPWSLSQWNGSWLGPFRLPFRWGGNYAMSGGWWNLSMEYYSDTLFLDDLTGNRSEDFSVFSLVGLGPPNKTLASTPLGSLTWTGAVNAPPVSGKANLLWDSITVNPSDTSGNPENSFFTPAELTFPQATLSLSGNLWPLSLNSKDPGARKDPSANLVPPGENSGPLLPSKDAEPPKEPLDPLVSPERMAPVTLDGNSTPPQWISAANWALTPTFNTDTRFNMSSVTSPQGNNWNVLTSQWTGAYDAKINFQTGWSDNSWVTTDGLALHQQVQDTYYVSPWAQDPTNPAGVIDYGALDRQASDSLLTDAVVSVWKPWVAGGPFRESNVQYSLTTILWSASPSAPTKFLDWTKDTVTAHQTNTEGIWYLFEGSQTLKAQSGWQTNLPPLDPLQIYSDSLTYTLPWGQIWTKSVAYKTVDTWTFDPWESYAEWDPWKNVALSEDYQWSLQANQPQSSTSKLSMWGLSATYLQSQTIPYTWNPSTMQFMAGSVPAFLPTNLTVAYDLNLPKLYWWYYRNSFSTKIDFNWPINLQQYNLMPMSLTYTLTYSLARFLDFQVSESVTNNTAYLYFPNLVNSFGVPTMKPVNILTDIWDSVSFWDHDALERGGFKMSTLNVGLTHYLDDWRVSLTYTGSMQQNAAQSSYSWVSTMTLLVQWIPIPELKSQMQVDQDGNLTVVKNDDTTPAAAVTTPVTPPTTVTSSPSP